MRVVESLLERLCTELGFCLPPDEWNSIVGDPPKGIEAFARRVWEAEGMDVPASCELFKKLCIQIAEFPNLGKLQVMSEDGLRVAEVEPDADCRPLQTTQVLGSFAPGPGFERLVPHLQAVQRYWESDQPEAAFTASREMDDFGITAIDELGREYTVFNIVFQEGGLLFAISPCWNSGR